jgi:sialate O-acetylesterase
MLIRRPSPSVVLEHPQVRSISRRNWSDRPGGTPFWLGVQLSQWLGIPVGVINRAERGAGSGIQGWLSPAAASDPDPQVQSLLPSYGDGIYNQFDSLFAPIVPYAIRGVVWWQGEGDLRKTSELPADGILDYRILLPAVIRSWRYEWGQGDFPFLFVQLPVGGGLPAGVPVSALPAAPPASDRASLMRQAFLGALEAPNSWMVVSVDLEGGVHPKDRDAYHDRISRVIRTASYADPSVYSGPVFESATLEGNRVRIRFRVQTATGLHTDGGPLQGFSISADGEAFLWAEGQIEGEEVVVWNDAIVTPVEVRYAWNKSPVWANLFNSENLGASPFAAEIVSP